MINNLIRKAFSEIHPLSILKINDIYNWENLYSAKYLSNLFKKN